MKYYYSQNFKKLIFLKYIIRFNQILKVHVSRINSYLCNKGVWSKKRVRFKIIKVILSYFKRTGVLHQIPVLHIKFFVTYGYT